MTSFAALHYMLRYADPVSGHVLAGMHIRYAVHRSRVDSHPHRDLGSTLKRTGELHRAADGSNRIAKKHEDQAVAGGQVKHLTSSFRSAELCRGAYDFLKLLQNLNLLIHRRQGARKHLDRQDVRY